MTTTYRAGDGWFIIEYEDALADGLARMMRASDAAWPGGLRGSATFTADTVRREHRRVQRLAEMVAIVDCQVAGTCTVEPRSDRADTAWVGFLNVAPAFHGRKLGREMLRATVSLATERGFARVGLGTWPGNLKAVPLYKKTGFFWRPGTTVLMENYLPLLLRLPLLRQFLGGRDWYDCFVRELLQREDDLSESGVPVYPYTFAVEGRTLRLLVDRERGALCGYDHPDFSILPEVPGTQAPFGVPVRLAWRLRNQRQEPADASVALDGDGGVSGSPTESLSLVGERVLGLDVVAAENAGPAGADRRQVGVSGHAVFGQTLLPLALGLHPEPPFASQLTPAHAGLVAGVDGHAYVNVHSHVDRPVSLALTYTAGEGLVVEGLPRQLDLAAKATTGFPFLARADAPGLYSLVVRVQADGDRSLTSQQTLLLPCLGSGGLIDYCAGDDTVLECETTRVVLARRGGDITISDRVDGHRLLSGADVPGPAYRPRDLDRVDFEWRTRREDGAIVASAEVRSERHPEAVYTQEVSLVADGRVGRRLTVMNLSSEPIAASVMHVGWARDARALALPLATGLVYDSGPAFRQVAEDYSLTSAAFAEGWAALEMQQGYVAGLVWSRPLEYPQYSHVIIDLGTIPVGGSARSGWLWHVCRRGSWRDVRDVWRRLCAPSAPEECGEPVPGLAMRLLPAAVFDLGGNGAVAVEVANADSMPVQGEARLEAPPGWRAEPRHWRLELGPNSRFYAATTVTCSQSGPRAGEFGLIFDSQAEERRHRQSLFVAGSPGSVTVQRAGAAGQESLRLDNGYFTATIVPGYGGALVALEHEGHNQVLSTYPTPRAFLWMNDWYGGVRPVASISRPDRTVTESFVAEEVESGADPRWRGVRLTATMAQEGLRGYLLRAEYLTLPGSNILALRLALHNPTGARVTPTVGFECNLRPEGNAGATMHYRRDGEDRILRSSASMQGVLAGRWAAAEDPGSGRCLAVVAGQGCEGVSATIMGGEMVQTAPHRQAPLDGGMTASLSAYLVIAADVDQARLYRGLAGTAPGP